MNTLKQILEESSETPEFQEEMSRLEAVEKCLALTASHARLVKALEAHEVAGEMKKDIPNLEPNDPRYTPFIGEWDGYKAPEQRWAQMIQARRDLRKAALAEAKALTGEAR